MNVSSVAGRVGFPHLGYYCASKFALTGFSETLRQEVASKGIEVTLVSPGTIVTPMTRAILEEAKSRGKRVVTTPPEVAARAVLRSIETGEPEIFVPWTTRLLNTLHFVMPKFSEWLAWHFRAAENKE